MKTNKLTGAALDWAVAKCEELEIYFEDGIVCLVGQPFDTYWRYWNPSFDWAQAGPIIEQEGISLDKMYDTLNWCASMEDTKGYTAPTPLIAAMRCYVASKLGDNIKTPKELKQ